MVIFSYKGPGASPSAENQPTPDVLGAPSTSTSQGSVRLKREFVELERSNEEYLLNQ